MTDTIQFAEDREGVRMCRFCKDVAYSLIAKDVDVLNKKILFEVYLDGETLKLCSGEGYMKPLAKKKVKYCPMCGRKLND